MSNARETGRAVPLPTAPEGDRDATQPHARDQTEPAVPHRDDTGESRSDGTDSVGDNLLYSDVEEQLRASVRDLLTDRADPMTTLDRCERDLAYDLELWHTLAAELGATALHVPERFGGQGATVRETAVVLEELGRAVAPVPFLGSAVLASTVLLGCEPTEPVTELLGALAAGHSTGALATSLAAAPGTPFPDSVRADGDGLHGRIRSVADAAVADALLVPAIGGDGPELHLVRRSGSTSSGPVAVTLAVSLDLTRPVADVELTSAPSVPLATGQRAVDALTGALLTGAGLLASEQLGVAEWCLSTTVGYVGDRYQFGRPIGSFQALKHRLADLWQQVVLLRATARDAADTLANSPAPDTSAREAVSIAASLAASVAVHAAEECVQMHGGIGMTWEHPAHLFLKRAKADSIALGTAGAHRQLLAPLVDLPAPDQ